MTREEEKEVAYMTCDILSRFKSEIVEILNKRAESLTELDRTQPTQLVGYERIDHSGRIEELRLIAERIDAIDTFESWRRL
jgi:hypothetical protein